MQVRTLTIALVLSLVSIPSWSQWKETVPPPDSPYWWTLTDDVTPEELRRVHLDESIHKELYKKSQDLGIWPSLSEERQNDIALFILGALTPEYHPFAEVLWSFAAYVQHEQETNIESEQAQALSEYGMSEAGIARLMTVALESLDAEQVLIEELGDDQSAFARIVAKMQEELPLAEYQEILRKRQYSRIARLVGEDARTVRRYAEAWDREPYEEIYAAATAVLRKELSEKDWKILRRYFLTEFAPRMNETMFYSDTVRGVMNQ